MENSTSRKSHLRHSLWLFFCAFLFLSAPLSADAGQWQVIPIRLDLDQATRSGVLSITNQGKDPLTVDVEASRWLQDATGKDNYEKTDDLIFFPKTLTIAPGKERVIRTGIKVPAVKDEKAYRLFIEERPRGKKPADTGVALAIRFGVPIFSRPVKPVPDGSLGALEFKGGQLEIPITNTGNVHFRISSIQLIGKDSAGQSIFDQKLNGWYLLHGQSRTYSAKVPAEVCQKLDSLTVQVQTDGIDMNGTIHVDKAMCLSKE